MWFYTSCVPYYAKDQKIQDALSPFVVKTPFTSDITGLITLPDTYEHLLAIYTQYVDNTYTRKRSIKILPEDQIADRLDSQTLAPSITKPVGMESGKGQIQLYPEVAIPVYLFYLRRPQAPVFVYTQPDDREISYNSGASKQLEWGESYINKILIKTLQLLGVNVSNEMIIQFAELKNSQDI